MSYQININGHVQTEDSKAFEETLAERAKAFVASIEGVSHAQLSGTTGTFNLMEGEVHEETPSEE